MHAHLDRDATPATLRQLAHDGILDANQLDSALRLVDARADAADWRRFTERTPLFAGVGLVLSGVVYFFAANWSALTRAHRLGLALAALMIAAIAAGWIGTSRLGGKVAAVAAALLVGPVLLTYGQAYQTGADAWELFAGWTLLALPFALAVRGPAIFTISLVLLRVTALLALKQVWGLDIDKAGALPMFLALFLVDAAAVGVAFSFGAKACGRLFAALGALTVALPLIFIVVGETRGAGFFGFALVSIAIAAHAAGITRAIARREAPLVAIVGVSAAVHVGVAVARFLFDGLDLHEGGLLLMGSFVLCEAGALAWLLRRALR